MPRAHFTNDLTQAMSDSSIPSIVNVQAGTEDGQFTLDYVRPGPTSVCIKIEIVINGITIHPLSVDWIHDEHHTDTFLYRLRHHRHHFYVYAALERGVPDAASSALERISRASGGLTIRELLCSIAMELDQVFPEPDLDVLSELARLYIRLDLN